MTWTQRGDKALAGEEEYLPGHLFDAVDYDRWITCKGTHITIYNPKASDNYWEHKNTTEVGTSLVPAGFNVRVIDAAVKMTKSSAG